MPPVQVMNRCMDLPQFSTTDADGNAKILLDDLFRTMQYMMMRTATISSHPANGGNGSVWVVEGPTKYPIVMLLYENQPTVSCNESSNNSMSATDVEFEDFMKSCQPDLVESYNIGTFQRAAETPVDEETVLSPVFDLASQLSQEFLLQSGAAEPQLTATQLETHETCDVKMDKSLLSLIKIAECQELSINVADENFTVERGDMLQQCDFQVRSTDVQNLPSRALVEQVPTYLDSFDGDKVNVASIADTKVSAATQPYEDCNQHILNSTSNDDDKTDLKEILDGNRETEIKKSRNIHQCRKCHKVLRNAVLFRMHEEWHSKQLKLYQCSYCDKFMTLTSLKRHELIHTGERAYQCSWCKKKFLRSDSLKSHERVHGKVTATFQCSQCLSKFATLYSLQRHEKQKHPNLVQKKKHPNLVQRKKSLVKPKKRLEETRQFQIKTSLKVTARKKCEQFDAGDNKYRCSKCKMAYRSSKALKWHQRTHMGSRPYACSYCLMTFRNSYHLKRHELIHTGERLHQCSWCKKTFNRSDYLTRHKEKYCRPTRKFSSTFHLRRRAAKNRPKKENPNDEASFVKSEENVKTRSVNNRARSLTSACSETTRTGLRRKKKYECSHCKKQYSTPGTLQIHKLIHTRDRLYRCLVCSKSFIMLHHLRRHEMIHKEKKSLPM